MKAIIILVILLTFSTIFLAYKRNKNIKKLLLSLGSIALIVSLAIVGNLTRPVFPIYIAHLVLVVVAWGGVVIYVIREKYYWWIIFSPVLTIILFLVLEFFIGSGHEII